MVRWVAALAPWAFCAGMAAGAMSVPPSSLPSRPVLREEVPKRLPDPPRPKGVRYEPWEEVPS